MSSTRSKLQLDEQSFQELLAAAYTIQEHADLLKPVTKTAANIAPDATAKSPRLCGHCAKPLKEDESLCRQCGWEESSLPEGIEKPERKQKIAASTLPNRLSIDVLASDSVPIPPQRSAEPASLQLEPLNLEAAEANLQDEPGHRDPALALDTLMQSVNLSDSPRDRLAELRQLLAHHRANLYLGVAVLVAFIALFWPTVAPTQKPRLDPWQRALVALGIAEPPPPEIHYQGDPNIQVWVDPHTALYYCAGDEQYGKAPGGRLTTQRDAQADQFEPAKRAACN